MLSSTVARVGYVYVYVFMYVYEYKCMYACLSVCMVRRGEEREGSVTERKRGEEGRRGGEG